MRDIDADYLKAVNEAIVARESAGLAATPYLLEQKAALEAKIAAKNPQPKPEPKPEPAREPEVEQKAEDPPAEAAVPRRPGRPRKPSD